MLMANDGLRGEHIFHLRNLFARTANAAEELEYRIPEEWVNNDNIPIYISKEKLLEQQIEKIIQQKLSDLLLSHVCPVCKKQLEE